MLGKSESAFEYILRHTFYTPRHVLDLCDKMISKILDNGRSDFGLEEAASKISKVQWDKIFQESVQEFAGASATNFCDLFGEIYEGLDDVLRAFKSRPLVWNRSQLLRYVEDNNLEMYRPDKETTFHGEALVSTLHRIGFLGLGTRDVSVTPLGVYKYNIKFSFLEKNIYQGGWELAVIAPLFYDTYDIRPVDKVIVNPHEKLNITSKAMHVIMNYDIETNL